MAVAAPACGGGHAKPAVTTTLGSTTSTTPAKVVTVTPASGPVGTVFTFTLKGFDVGEHLHFEVDFPNGHTFVGQSHPVAADGSFTTSYTATKGNPTGTYTVKAIGDQGSTANSQFQLTSGSAPATSSTTTGKSTTATTTAQTLPGG